MLLGMLGFALVWLAQLPFGLAAVWWERRHDVSELGYLEWVVSSWFALGGVFLFICLAIRIVMALAAPLGNRWWIAGAPVFVGARPAVRVRVAVPVTTSSRCATSGSRRPRTGSRGQQGLPRIPVEVAEVKEFTTAPNAEAAGLGPSRRVILWDTLLGRPFDDGEVRRPARPRARAPLARPHLEGRSAGIALFAVPMAFVIAARHPPARRHVRPAAVPLALLVLVLLQIAVTPLQNVVTRRVEAEADWVALETTRDPSAAREVFVDLAETSLGRSATRRRWAYLLEGTHPTIMQRIAMADAWRRPQRRRPATPDRLRGASNTLREEVRWTQRPRHAAPARRRARLSGPLRRRVPGAAVALEDLRQVAVRDPAPDHPLPARHRARA